jgi:hypothetical protein
VNADNSQNTSVYGLEQTFAGLSIRASYEEMNALVKNAARKGVTIQEVDVPTILDNEVLEKVKSAAICGTDIHILIYRAPSPSSD